MHSEAFFVSQPSVGQWPSFRIHGEMDEGVTLFSQVYGESHRALFTVSCLP